MSLPLLTPDRRAALPLFARQFFRGLFACQKTSVVVFDDYHEVAADSALHQCVANGLEEVPDGCRVIIVSRAPPPPQLAKLRMNGVVDVVEPDALRMTLDEAKGLARERGAAASGANVATIVRQTQGWTAGLILMLEAGAETVSVPTDGTPVPEVLFDYFAGEILQRMDASAQRLLCMLALMPATTVSAAERLTGAVKVGAILEDLRTRNYFTTRDTAAEPRYRFHPLFRDFLLETARRRLAKDELAALSIQAAEVLDEEGQGEAAVGLLEQARAFDRLALLVKRRAEALSDEGRQDTLLAWLAKLPAALIGMDGWLTYWSGAVRVFSHPDDALSRLAKAFSLFRDAHDVTGQFVTWASQAEAIRVDAFGDQARFDPLREAMDDLLERHPSIPPGKTFLRVAMSMAIGLARRGNDRAAITLWQQRARAAAKEAPGQMVSNLVGHWFAVSDLHDARYEAACRALDALPDPLTQDHRTLIADVSGYTAHAIALLYRQRKGDCAAYIEEVIRRMEAGGSIVWTHHMAALAAGDAYRRGDLAAFGTWLRRTGEYADRVTTNRGAHFHTAAAQYHAMSGNLAAARNHAETAVALSVQIGWPFYEAFARQGRIEVLLDLGDFDEAGAEIARIEHILANYATGVASFPAALLKADLAFARGDMRGATALLSDAMTLGRRQGDRSANISVVRTGRLCTIALKSGIEPDYVRTFIRASGIPAPDPDNEDWPWPLKIMTLGDLVVVLDGRPLTFGRKTPKRLITLLKAIVTYGGRDVPEEKLIDAVWPDEEGDAGHSALTIAIHRLRKLLGDPGAVVVKAGRVGLDPARCWLDLWTFDRRLARRGADETEACYRERVARGLALYRGAFLADDEDLWWTTKCREQMRERCKRVSPQTID